MNKALVCVLIFLSMGMLQARPQESDSLRSKTAVLFNVVSLNLQGYNGGIGFKYFLGKSLAIKAGVDMSYSDNRENDPNTYDEYFSLSKSIGFTVDIEKYFSVKDNLKFYLGAGGGPQWSKRTSDYYSNSGANSVNRGDRYITTSLRANLLFGAEYALNKTFSLTFEQTLSGIYSFGKQQSYQNEEASENELESFKADLGSSALILVIYF